MLSLWRYWTEPPLYGGEVTRCPEAESAAANSRQSPGFIGFSDEASHVFSAPSDGCLHLIIPHQRRGRKENVLVLLYRLTFSLIFLITGLLFIMLTWEWEEKKRTSETHRNDSCGSPYSMCQILGAKTQIGLIHSFFSPT